MPLTEVVALNFLTEEGPGLADIGDIVADTGADQMVLEPLIGALDLALGLGREGVDDLHVAVVEDLLPLRVHLIGDFKMVLPSGIAAADEAKDGMGVDVVGQRQAVFQEDRLKGEDMSPRGFGFNEFRVKDEARKIVQGSDEDPFFLSGGSPEVDGGIVLDELSGVVGENLAVVGGSFWFSEVEAVFLSAVDDGGQRGFLVIFID